MPANHTNRTRKAETATERKLGLSETQLRDILVAELSQRNPGAPKSKLKRIARIMSSAGLAAAGSPVSATLTSPSAKTRRRPRRRDAPFGVARGTGLGEILSEEEGGARLEAVRQPEPLEAWAGELLRPMDVVERFDIARSTLDSWRRSGAAVAIEQGLKRHVYPAGQFVQGGVLRGIGDVIAAASGQPKVAWRWLVTPNVSCGGERPIDRLAQGDAADVILAAQRDLG